jgi:hypothetical protein
MNVTELDALIYEVIVDANGEDEQLWAFRQAFEDALSLPADGFVIGEPVAVIAFDYDGNEKSRLSTHPASTRRGGLRGTHAPVNVETSASRSLTQS